MTKLNFTGLSITASAPEELWAAQLFASEIMLRTGLTPSISAALKKGAAVIFLKNDTMKDKDCCKISLEENKLTVEAYGIRGFIYGYAFFLRKTVYHASEIMLIKDISGEYKPYKKLRGHQLGYRSCNNTYDAWTTEQYFRYYLDLMYFGMNTVEHIPYEKGFSERNEIMRYDEEELLKQAVSLADSVDLDVSLWYPNSEKDIETASENRRRVFSSCKRINAVFPPGGDPGSLMPDELFKRCGEFRRILKERHPEAQMLPSAQQPHEFPDWGEKFIDELQVLPDGVIDGIITGPNHAFELDETRRRVPGHFPLRFYPDITHNVRCEYPVHFDRDDWHYAFACTESRECVNPRPTEYTKIHTLTERYVTGSVSYSEGVNDDINKAVWGNLDFFRDVSVSETLEDYARLFFFGADASKVKDGILGLEKNWEGAPDENPNIENTLALWVALGEEVPRLRQSWRYIQCLFRAQCDAFVRRKILFENTLIEEAASLTEKGCLRETENTLHTPFSQDILFLRDEIEINAALLYELIGMQLDTERYHASGWERGAVLCTIDRNITDRLWLLNKFEAAANLESEKASVYMKRMFNRNRVESDEYYFSVAKNGLDTLGTAQTPGFYMDFHGDRPSNDGTLPVSLFKLFDHFAFSCVLGGFNYNTDYVLMLTLKNACTKEKSDFTIKANKHVIYHGEIPGGERNTVYEKDMLPNGFIAVMYRLPAEVFKNGCLTLEITEPSTGVEIGEFRITKTPYTA